MNNPNRPNSRRTKRHTRPTKGQSRRPTVQIPMRQTAVNRWQRFMAEVSDEGWDALRETRGQELVSALSAEQRDSLEQRATRIALNRHNGNSPAPAEPDIIDIMRGLAIEDDFMEHSSNNTGNTINSVNTDPVELSMNNKNVKQMGGKRNRNRKSKKNRSKRNY